MTETKNVSLEQKLLSINTKYYPLIAGLLSGLAAFLALSFSNMLSGGIYVMVRGDLFETHIPYILEMCRSILNGESIWYSYSVSMGMNLSLSIAYYTLSPFNILFLIFNKADANVILAIVIILKIACAGLCFSIFSKNVLKVNNIWNIVVSLCYALCGFSTAYGFYHIMWLDAFLMMPLLFTVIYKSFKNNRFVAVSLCYAYLFITQFYMGYMVGVFSFLFVIYLLVYDYSNIKQFILKLIKWIGSVILAICLSSFVWLPALLFLMSNNPPDATSFNDLDITVFQVFNTMFWGQFVDTIGRYSFSYSGLLPLLLLPFYFKSTKIALKEKILSSIVLGFLILCYISPLMYKLIHANDAPDMFWFRFTFLFSFLICSMALRTTVSLNEIKISSLFKYIAVLSLFYFVEQRIQTIERSNYVANSLNNYLMNILFFALWVLIIYLLENKEKNRCAFMLIAIVLSLSELISNTCMNLQGKTLESAYYNYDFICKNAAYYLNDIDTDFYRVINNNDLIHNSDSQYGYKGVSDFGSAENYNLRMTMSNLGFGTTPRMTLASGYNPVNEMLLGIRYIIYGKYYFDYGFNDYPVNDLVSVARNEKSLNIGYMVNDDVLNFQFPSRNDFENLNALMCAMSGLDEKCFYPIDKEDIEYTYDNSLVYTLNDSEDNNYYIEKTADDFEVTVNISPIEDGDPYVQFELENPIVYENSYSFTSGIVNGVNGHDYALAGSATYRIYESEDGCKFKFGGNEKSPTAASFDNINYYYYKHNSIDSHYDILSEQQLYVTDFENGYLKGNVDVLDEGKVLFLSIPYDKGWKAYANGTEISIHPVLGDAFMSIELPKCGKYEIELKYTVPGLKIGTIVTIIGALTIILIGFLEGDFKRLWDWIKFKSARKQDIITDDKNSSINLSTIINEKE